MENLCELRQKKITMAKILTGVQSTGTPHLGNLLYYRNYQMILNESFLLLPIL
jgi:tryptophanyl-tRNA synthetase